MNEQQVTAAAAAAPSGNMPLAILGGVVAALIGAAIWAVVTVSTNSQIGFMAIGVGLLVGYAVRILGKGNTQAYSIVGAVLALLGCVLGNLFSACAFIADAQSVPVASEIASVVTDFGLASRLMQASFDGMDLVFYAIAAYEGFKFARVAPAAKG